MNDPLLEKLARIREYYREYKIMPTYDEICELLGYNSKNAAFKLVDKLVEMGFVEKMDKGRLKPGPHFAGMPLYSSVSAGPATAEEEVLVDRIDLNDYLVRKPEKTILINVRGDSMIEAGIQESDKVVVETGASVRVGDIVVAIVDGDYTVKYLDQSPNGQVILHPANANYSPIIPRGELKIFGKVIGVIRKL